MSRARAVGRGALYRRTLCVIGHSLALIPEHRATITFPRRARPELRMGWPRIASGCAQAEDAPVCRKKDREGVQAVQCCCHPNPD
jgi:hypothetical protein